VLVVCFFVCFFFKKKKKKKFRLEFEKEVIAPPPMIGSMQRSFGGVRPEAENPLPLEKGKYSINLDPQSKRCLYCHKANISLQRCGKCKGGDEISKKYLLCC
jgi:hypothetical protein